MCVCVCVVPLSFLKNSPTKLFYSLSMTYITSRLVHKHRLVVHMSWLQVQRLPPALRHGHHGENAEFGAPKG